MISVFDKALGHTLGIEGGYSDNPDDSGGVTNYGITEQTARAFGYTGPMAALPLKVAVDIYRRNYWDLLWLDQIAVISEEVAIELFDTAVNCSPGFAGRTFQRALNVLNQSGRLYPDLALDGLLGRVSIAALQSYIGKRGAQGEKVLVKVLNSLQGAHYVSIAESRVKNESFVYGWFLNRI